MPRGKRTKPEVIIATLRKIEILLGEGIEVDHACKQAEITKQTYYRWKKEYGGMQVDQAKKLKDLESENARLKKLVANLSLDNQMLKEVAKGNF